jgi:hypothetical protein
VNPGKNSSLNSPRKASVIRDRLRDLVVKTLRPK